MVNIGNVAIEEIFSYLAVPGGATASHLLNGIFKAKAEEARKIFLAEISQGGAPEMAEDDAIYIIYRYLRAAQEGAAKTNLRLLAKVISGHKNLGGLKADKFLYYADILSSLKEEEITLLGLMIRNQKRDISYEDRKALEKQLDDPEYIAIYQSLLRTGLIYLYQEIKIENNHDWKSNEQYKGELYTSYYLTSLMDEILSFLSWDELMNDQ